MLLPHLCANDFTWVAVHLQQKSDLLANGFRARTLPQPDLLAPESRGCIDGVFPQAVIATAIFDRLLHHSTTIITRGESYRLKKRRKAGLTPLPG
jgi:hypothetical protein